MNGFQVGLVNFGGAMQGTQLGLVNFYHRGDLANTKDGTSIGLLNIGQSYSFQIYADEIFLTNYAFLTGTGKNFRLIDASNWVYIYNGLIFGYNPHLFKKDGSNWMGGYGLYRMVFNRSALANMNEFRFLSTGIEFLHYNKGGELNRHLNLLTRVKVAFGSRVHPKLSGVYMFAGLSYNFVTSQSELGLSNNMLSKREERAGRYLERWPGFNIGVMMH